IISDKNGNIWIGTYSNGLCSFNIQTQKFTRYPYIINDGEMKPNNKLDDDQISSMLFDDEGILWIGTNNGGLNRFDIKTNQFKSYLDNDQGFYCVISLLEDSKKRLWVGTYLSGLFLFDKNTGTLTKYSEQDGLLHNTVQYLKEDNAGNIWCGSERGFSRLNPEDKSIVVFDNLSKHLAGARQNLIYVDSIGTFYINLSKGIMSFNPADIKANMVPPSVVIESVRYQPDGADFGKDTIVYTEVNQKIVLRYNENRINFQYVALHFVDAENNQYAYQLVGYDKDWIQAGTQRNATYTNLSPGTYTFKVKAANSDGVWNNTGTSITIKILPPWWKTWWAYVLYILIISASIRGYIHYRSKALRKKNLVLEEKVTHRTKQLQESIENLKTTQSQLVQSEKMASLGELTAGIAHEIQNPLNFVNNFSEVNTELIDELKTELAIGNKQLAIELADDIKANEQKINHHGKRADAIVKGMLQHSRSSTGRKELSDINALCDEYLRLSYHGLRAKDKTFNATMKTDFDNSIGEINIISQDIGRVILNLLTNAFYAVSEKKKQLGDGYEPTVSINTREVNKHIEIHVSDNGNGIPQNILDKIFQPFFTTKPTGQGTGLGLSLSYDIITKGHGGELKVETKEGEGSVFIILLPVV
ncbi:MAG: ATP-binding protein, partial [Chitinophagales bacterium]